MRHRRSATAPMLLLVGALLVGACALPGTKAPLPKVVIGKGNKPGMTFQGWICPKCGCEVDRMGNKIGQSHTKKPDAK